MKQYNRRNISLARVLRTNQTPWERKLWHCFLRSHPVRFQRQKAIDEYIVDFYCAKAKLAIELDGGEHYREEQQKQDQLRTENLQKSGITVMRLCNLDVDNNFQGVCEHIDSVLKGSLPQSR